MSTSDRFEVDTAIDVKLQPWRRGGLKRGGLMEDRIPIAGPSISQRRLITPSDAAAHDGTPAQGNIRAASIAFASISA